MGAKDNILDFCAYRQSKSKENPNAKELTVRDLVHGIEIELACGSEFYLIGKDPLCGVPISTQLHDPKAIAICIVKTNAHPECGTVAIKPVAERRRYFEAVQP